MQLYIPNFQWHENFLLPKNYWCQEQKPLDNFCGRMNKKVMKQYFIPALGMEYKWAEGTELWSAIHL